MIPTILFFYKENNIQCDSMRLTLCRVFEEIKWPGDIIEIDIAKNNKYKNHYKIIGVPTLVLTNAHKTCKYYGELLYDELIEIINSHLQYLQ